MGHSDNAVARDLKPLDPNTVGWIEDAIDALSQYAEYAEKMREIGRGFAPSGPFSTDQIIYGLKRRLEANKAPGPEYKGILTRVCRGVGSSEEGEKVRDAVCALAAWAGANGLLDQAADGDEFSKDVARQLRSL